MCGKVHTFAATSPRNVRTPRGIYTKKQQYEISSFWQIEEIEQGATMHCRMAFLVVFLGVLGMFGTMESAHAGVYIEKTSYRGWKNCYRMTNGTIDLVIVPQVGRIMRYGFAGGPNMLWENPTVAGKPIPLGEWPNTGGDKIWPWKQDDWGKITGTAWPPPPGADQAAHQAEIIGKDTVRMTSTVVVPYGMRIVRDIRLAPSGTQVFLSNRFVKIRDGADYNVGVWTITQVPATSWVLARLTSAASALDGSYITLAGNKEKAGFAAITPLTDGALKVERRSDSSAKLGTEADLLASLQNDLLFTVRIAPTIPADNAGATYEKGERAQIYNQPDNTNDASRGITPYIELEFTSPRKVLKNGGTLTLDQIWEIRRLPKEKLDAASVAGVLKEIQ
jgi:hypothetical protein